MKTFRIFMAIIATSGLVNALRIADFAQYPEYTGSLVLSMALLMIGGFGLVATISEGRHERGSN